MTEKLETKLLEQNIERHFLHFELGKNSDKTKNVHIKKEHLIYMA